MRISVISDDFTGAIDTGVTFTKWGYDTLFHLWDDLPKPDPEVLVLSTDSREVDEVTAEKRIRQTAARMENRQLFKKIDSTLRGNIRCEVISLLEASGLHKAVICPATIEAGRTTKAGKLFVHEQPIHETAFANDPFWPATTSQISDLLRDPSIINLDLAIVRQGHLSQAIASANAPLVTVDAVSQADLLTIAQAIIETDCLPCGAMGLGSAWIQTLSGKTSPAVPISPEYFYSDTPLLIIVGSLHPVTRQQITAAQQMVDAEVITIQPDSTLPVLQNAVLYALTARPIVIVRMPWERLWDKEMLLTIRHLLGQMVQTVVEKLPPGGLVIVGGETAALIARLLEMRSIRILGEIEPGVPIGQIVGGHAASLPIVTKAGGFGNDRTLISVVNWFRGSIKGE